MAPSPRKTASSTFNQTWHETDVAFLDPNSLPISKAPRAWERKAQLKVSRDGKQKKVFRRYTLRSHVTDSVDAEDEDEKEQDSRSRAVKKLQRMSPGAMEKDATMSKGKRRAFKATRWDRRKSVLPREIYQSPHYFFVILIPWTGKKNASHNNLMDIDETNDADEDTIDTIEDGNNSVMVQDISDGDREMPTIASPIPVEGVIREPTANFAFDGRDHDSTKEEPSNLPELCEDSRSATSDSGLEQDGITQFTFRSPIKMATPFKRSRLAENAALSPQNTMHLLFGTPSKQASPMENDQLPSTMELLSGTSDASVRPLSCSPTEQMSPVKFLHLIKETTLPSEKTEDANTQELSSPLSMRFSPNKVVQSSDRANRSPQVEQDATIQLLFQSPSNAISPRKHALSTETESHLCTLNVQGAELLDSTVSDIMEQDHSVTLCGDSEACTATTTVLEEHVSVDSTRFVHEVATEDRTASDRDENEKEEEFSMVFGTDVDRPVLEQEMTEIPAEHIAQLDEDEDTEMTEVSYDLTGVLSPESLNKLQDEQVEIAEESPRQDSSLTESSLQLEIRQGTDMSIEPVETEETMLLQEHTSLGIEAGMHEDTITEDVHTSSKSEDEKSESAIPSIPLANDALGDIADGLTLDFSVPSSEKPATRRLRSLSPPPQESGPDVTMTLAMDDDTAILKDFLTRAAASKANKTISTARRESLINRRDSDAIRQALASPRKILEEKDTNSPSKYDNDTTVELTQTLTLDADIQLPMSPMQDQGSIEATEDTKSSRSSRRSNRTRKSRLPAPSAPQPAQGPTSISVRRADGADPIVLKGSEAKQLADLVRSNTRKNKQGALAVNLKLIKLKNEAAKFAPEGIETTSLQESDDHIKIPATDPVSGKKNVRWDETLEYFQENQDTIANMKADAESLATPDELSLPLAIPTAKPKIKLPRDKATTSKIRRVKDLGTANGTPGKGLLGPVSMLPDDVMDEQETSAPSSLSKGLPKPKSSRVKKMPVAITTTDKVTMPSLLPSTTTAIPSLDPAPTAGPVKDSKITKERRSRLATPKKVTLPQPISAVPVPIPVAGKENHQSRGIAAATPKKGIPVPIVTAPSTIETGLPRRRAKKI